MSGLRNRKNDTIPVFLLMRELPLIAFVFAAILGNDYVKVGTGFVAGVWMPCALSWYWNRMDLLAFTRPFAMMIPILPL